MSYCKSCYVKTTGIRAQPESSPSIRRWWALPWKRSCHTAGFTLSSGSFWSELHPQWCESRAASCHEAEPARYALCVSGLCWADLRGTEGAGLRIMRAYAWMFLPFLEEAHCLWHSKRRSIRSSERPQRVCASFISRPLKKFEWVTIVTVGNTFSDLTAALGRWCQFPQSCPQMRSSTPMSHEALGQLRCEYSSFCNTTP